MERDALVEVLIEGEALSRERRYIKSLKEKKTQLTTSTKPSLSTKLKKKICGRRRFCGSFGRKTRRK